MTYIVKKRPFYIATISSGQDIPAQQNVNLELTQVMTSHEVLNTTNVVIKEGLAFSDMYTYDTGGGSPNLNPNAGHSPKLNGGFGSIQQITLL